MSYASLGYSLPSIPGIPSIPSGGVVLPSIPGLDLNSIGNSLVAAVGPPIIAALKKEIPGVIAQITPQIEAEVKKLQTQIWTSPEVQKAKKQAMIGAAFYALLIIGGTYAAVKYL
jgi:hypothetical protein